MQIVSRPLYGSTLPPEHMKHALDALHSVMCRVGVALHAMKQARDKGDELLFDVLQDAASRELDAGIEIFEALEAGALKLGDIAHLERRNGVRIYRAKYLDALAKGAKMLPLRQAG